MAGHSKWANIKHRKGAQDASRAKEFQKLAKEIYVAAKTGDPSPDMNPLLRLAITKAKAANMPNEKINNALAKATGKNNTENYDNLIYEGYGPAGVAMMVDCLTDNKNRTASMVRAAFTKYGGNLGTDGSVSYLFVRRGLMVLETNFSEDKIIESAIEAGAIDVNYDQDVTEIITTDKDFMTVKDNLEKAGINQYLVAEITYIPNTYLDLKPEDISKAMSLIEALEDIEDVNNVYYNIK